MPYRLGKVPVRANDAHLKRNVVSSRTREATSSRKDEEAIAKPFSQGGENSRKPRYISIAPDQTKGFDHVEHRRRPDLLVDNRAGLAVNLTRRGQGPGSGVPEEFASASIAGTSSRAMQGNDMPSIRGAPSLDPAEPNAAFSTQENPVFSIYL
jgi:hypothetical protein